MTTKEQKSLFINIFPTLTREDVEALFSIVEYVNTPKKKIIISAGSVNQSILFLIKGMIRGYFINENGEEKNIFLRPENTMTGAPECLFHNQPTKYFFEAMPRSKYLSFSKPEFDDLLDEYPNLKNLWMRALQENILTLVGRVESLIDKNPEKRYEQLLKTSPTFFQTAYNKHIANYLGMTSVSLSRIIKRKSSRKN